MADIFEAILALLAIAFTVVIYLLLPEYGQFLMRLVMIISFGLLLLAGVLTGIVWLGMRAFASIAHGDRG